MFALATPVQFYVGRQYYVGAYKALRNGSANMDVLVAMGSSAAYFYSIPVTAGAARAGMSTSRPSAVIITLIKLGKFLEARAKGQTSEAIKKLMGLQRQDGACAARRSGAGNPGRRGGDRGYRARASWRKDPGGWRGDRWAVERR